jgi:hypothetical protein
MTGEAIAQVSMRVSEADKAEKLVSHNASMRDSDMPADRNDEEATEACTADRHWSVGSITPGIWTAIAYEKTQKIPGFDADLRRFLKTYFPQDYPKGDASLMVYKLLHFWSPLLI